MRNFFPTEDTEQKKTTENTEIFKTLCSLWGKKIPTEDTEQKKTAEGTEIFTEFMITLCSLWETLCELCGKFFLPSEDTIEKRLVL